MKPSRYRTRKCEKKVSRKDAENINHLTIPRQQIVQTGDVSLVAHDQSSDNQSFQEHLMVVLDALNQKLLKTK